MRLSTPLQTTTKSIIGAMSGTSMDGLDLALCRFTVDNERYSYEINAAETYEYPSLLLELLETSKQLTPEQLFLLDKKLGQFYAACINAFIQKNEIDKTQVDAIASHGHTIFHQPDKGFTVQLGCGDTIATSTGIRTINDFRQKDVICGGQGAPLVPIGDKLLFANEADGFLNIGGFSNISIPGVQTIAFDVCPGNLPLNLAAMQLGHSYDKDGNWARSGTVRQEVLEQLNALPFYAQKAPKSLGTEWLESEFLPLLHTIETPEDRLRTCVEHIAEQIGVTAKAHAIDTLFVTGGGALNSFLMERIESKGINTKLPEMSIIQFKEALIFAFLGLRFLEEKPNCLASVTGASHDVCGGVLHLP